MIHAFLAIHALLALHGGAPPSHARLAAPTVCFASASAFAVSHDPSPRP